MSTSLQLQIPEPCHENWDTMTPKEQGRFCGSCQKTVVDFSLMTDKEILDYFSTASQHVCGRFSNDQLSKALKVPDTRKRFSFAYFWNLLLATLLITEADAQVHPVKKKQSVMQKMPEPKMLGKPALMPVPEAAILPVTIKGTVTDAGSNQPITGASVHIQGTPIGTAADTSGNFSFSAEKKDSVVLEFSAIGYESQTRVIDNYSNWQDVKVLLQPAATSLPAVETIAWRTVGKIIRTGGVLRTVKVDTTEKIKRIINDWVPAALKKDVRVFPNPVIRGNDIQVSLALQQPGEYTVHVLNTAGQVMLVKPIILQTKEQVIILPTNTAWGKGVYWVRVASPRMKNIYQAKVLVN